MQVIITSATAGECSIAAQQLQQFNQPGLTVRFHQAGVGMLATAVSLTALVMQTKPDLVIQAGIAGCFDNGTELGGVYAIGQEALADLGVVENNQWKDLFDLNLLQPGEKPFTGRVLPNHWLTKYNLLNLPVVNSITINEITTSPIRKQQITEKYQPFIESMEGAALHYTGILYNIPFIQIRSTSNFIGERDKTKWKMKEAIINLNRSLVEYVNSLVTINFNTLYL